MVAAGAQGPSSGLDARNGEQPCLALVGQICTIGSGPCEPGGGSANSKAGAPSVAAPKRSDGATTGGRAEPVVG